MATAASHAFSMSLTPMFLPAGAAVAGFAALAVAGFAAVVVVDDASFLAALAGDGVTMGSFVCEAGVVASEGVTSGAVSTLADGFSSAAGAVDSVGAGDSSCANVMAARKRDAKNGTMIFM